MKYHIDTEIIVEKFSSTCDCPLCEIQKVVEEQFLHEFLNDAVMEDNTRILVGKRGFCERHFDMLFNRPNKLSVALQIKTRLDKTSNLLSTLKNAKSAKKRADEIDNSLETCVICDLVSESMTKYYKTVAQMFYKEREFLKTLLRSGGFCMRHYAQLLRYSSYAGGLSSNYLEVLSNVQQRSFSSLNESLNEFCQKHDYRNALKPLSKNAENSLANTRTRLYGKKMD